MKEQKLSRGIVFEARGKATVFGNYLNRTISVLPHDGKTIMAEDIDSGIKEVFLENCHCGDRLQIEDMIWEGGPVANP